jgi:hypothetical protein
MEHEVNAEILICKVQELTDKDKVLWNITSDQKKYILSLSKGRIVASVEYIEDPFEGNITIYTIEFFDNSGQSIAKEMDSFSGKDIPGGKNLAIKLYKSVSNQIERINNKKLGLLYEDLISRS